MPPKGSFMIVWGMRLTDEPQVTRYWNVELNGFIFPDD